jgi:hypothetical protein
MGAQLCDAPQVRDQRRIGRQSLLPSAIRAHSRRRLRRATPCPYRHWVTSSPAAPPGTTAERAALAMPERAKNLPPGASEPAGGTAGAHLSARHVRFGVNRRHLHR